MDNVFINNMSSKGKETLVLTKKSDLYWTSCGIKTGKDLYEDLKKKLLEKKNQKELDDEIEIGRNLSKRLYSEVCNGNERK